MMTRFKVAQIGSNRQFKHPDELAKGTQMTILKQAGLRSSEQL